MRRALLEAGQRKNSSPLEAMELQVGKDLMREAQGGPAEKEIELYLQKCGLLVDRSIINQDRAEEDRHRRYLYHQSIRSLLNNYRRFRNMFGFLKKNFIDQLREEQSGTECGDVSEEELFSRLSQHLDLLSVQEERRFEHQYRPQIAVCRRFEMALSSLKLGMQILKAENPEAYEMINFVYIKEDRRPTIKEAISELGLAGSSSYYQKMERAQMRLADLVFGYCVNKEDLFDILVLLRQQSSETSYPDY